LLDFFVGVVAVAFLSPSFLSPVAAAESPGAAAAFVVAFVESAAAVPVCVAGSGVLPAADDPAEPAAGIANRLSSSGTFTSILVNVIFWRMGMPFAPCSSENGIM